MENEKGRLWSLYCKEPTLDKYKMNIQQAIRKGDKGAILSIRAKLMQEYKSGIQVDINKWIAEVKCD